MPLLAQQLRRHIRAGVAHGDPTDGIGFASADRSYLIFCALWRILEHQRPPSSPLGGLFFARLSSSAIRLQAWPRQTAERATFGCCFRAPSGFGYPATRKHRTRKPPEFNPAALIVFKADCDVWFLFPPEPFAVCFTPFCHTISIVFDRHAKPNARPHIPMATQSMKSDDFSLLSVRTGQR